MTELLLAAYYGELEWMQNCINGGLDIHARDNCGMTPLHWVVDMGMVGESSEREEIVKLLIASGADVQAADNTGESVLSRAILAGNNHLVQILIDAKADVNQADEKGVKPLHVAISNHNRDSIKLLKNAGAVY